MTLIEETSSINALTEAWIQVKSGKSKEIWAKSKGIDEESILDFSMNVSDNIKTISSQLSSGNYHMSPLKGFSESKKNGKLRLISAPTVRDRIVHVAILDKIVSYFPKIRNEASFCLPKEKNKRRVSFKDAFRRIIEQVRNGNKFVFESDVQSFFDKISKSILLDEIVKALPDESINILLQEIIYFQIGNLKQFQKKSEEGKIVLPENEKGLSQGSPLSPLFANVYLIDFDKKMIEKFGKGYIRYVDDFIVLCESHQRSLVAFELSNSIVNAAELSLPPLQEGLESKTRIVDISNGDALVFLGLIISKTGIYPEEKIAELKNYLDNECFRIRNKKKKMKKKKNKERRKEASIFVNRKIQGRFGYFGYFHTEEIVKELNEFIKIKSEQANLVVKNININKRGMPLVEPNTWKSFF